MISKKTQITFTRNNPLFIARMALVAQTNAAAALGAPEIAPTEPPEDGTALLAAIEANDTPAIAAILERGVPTGMTLPNRVEAENAADWFLYATERKAEQACISLLARCNDEDLAVYEELALSSVTWSPELAKTILERNIVDLDNSHMVKAVVFDCSREGHADVAQMLVDEGCLAICGNGDRAQTAVHVAAGGWNAPVLKVWLEAGMDAGALDDERARPLHYAARDWPDESVPMERFGQTVDLLLAHGADIDAGDIRCNSALSIACVDDETGPLWLLLARGADPLKDNGAGICPLYTATVQWQPQVLLAMREAGTDLSAVRLAGRTLLHLAAMSLQANTAADPEALALLRDTLQVLLEAGLPLEARDETGHTPLMSALTAGDAARLKMLVEMGADRRATTPEGAGLQEVLAEFLQARRVSMDEAHEVGTLLASWRARDAMEVLLNPGSARTVQSQP